MHAPRQSQEQPWYVLHPIQNPDKGNESKMQFQYAYLHKKCDRTKHQRKDALADIRKFSIKKQHLLKTRLTRCRHIGTLPPAGMGSLRDCGIVQRGNLSTMQSTDSRPITSESILLHTRAMHCSQKRYQGVNATQADDYTCCTAHVCRKACCETQEKTNEQMNACKHRRNLCIMHRLSCQPSQHMCWGIQQCTLT